MNNAWNEKDLTGRKYILIECQTHEQKINNATTTDPTCLILTNIYTTNYRKEARI